jgi:hypothetical protein
MSFHRLLLAALLACFVVVAIAQVDETADTEAEDAEADDYEHPEEETDVGIFAHTIFDAQLADSQYKFFTIGQPVKAHVTMINAPDNLPYDVFFLSSYITRLHDHNPLQNYSGIRLERSIAGGESATFRYEFTPMHVDPMDYTLVVRFFARDHNNNTYFVIAYNNTVSLEEHDGTDAETVFTYAFLAAIVICAGYVVKLKYFKSRPSRSSGSSAARQSSTGIEAGTKAAYNPDFISSDHLAFKEAYMRRTTPSPKKQ